MRPKGSFKWKSGVEAGNQAHLKSRRKLRVDCLAEPGMSGRRPVTCGQQQSAVVKTSRDDAEKESADSVPPKKTLWTGSSSGQDVGRVAGGRVRRRRRGTTSPP